MPHSRLRLVFAGTPAAAVPSLATLAGSRHELAAVVTRPDAPLGRKRVLTPSPVASWAEQTAIPVVKAARLDAATTAEISEHIPDLGVIVAYGGLVREPLLSSPRLGWINLHFSLLPRWRGAAPVQHAILAGDRETGAAVFQLVPELDAGDVFAEIRQPIGDQQTAGELLELLAVSGASLLERVVDDLSEGRAVAIPQTGEVTVATKLDREDGHIRFTESAAATSARIRAMTPEPGAYTEIAGVAVKILSARIAEDALTSDPGELAWDGRRLLAGTTTAPIELVAVQPSGKRAMSASDWWRGLTDRGGLVAR
jgi:methionyl-tRNA formyltransferase